MTSHLRPTHNTFYDKHTPQALSRIDVQSIGARRRRNGGVSWSMGKIIAGCLKYMRENAPQTNLLRSRNFVVRIRHCLKNLPPEADCKFSSWNSEEFVKVNLLLTYTSIIYRSHTQLASKELFLRPLSKHLQGLALSPHGTLTHTHRERRRPHLATRNEKRARGTCVCRAVKVFAENRANVISADESPNAPHACNSAM